MITLTIDRRHWEGGEDAYDSITANRGLSLFMRKLIRRGLVAGPEFFYAVEFHPKNNDWMHWHMCVRPEGTWPNSNKAIEGMAQDDGYWDLVLELGDLWGFGHCLHSDASATDSPEHAMNYLTKYIIKQDVGPPDWVMQRRGNFRKFSTSRGLCGPSKKRKESKKPRGNYRRRTPAEIVKDCGTETNLFEVTEIERKYMGGTETRKKVRFLRKVKKPLGELAADEKFMSHNEMKPVTKSRTEKKKRSNHG